MKFSSLNTKIGILLLLLLFISLLFYTQYLSLNSNSLSLLTSAKTYNQSQSPTRAPPPLRCPKGSTCNNQSKTCVSPQTPTGTQVPTIVPTSSLTSAFCGQDFSCPNELVCLDKRVEEMSYNCRHTN